MPFATTILQNPVRLKRLSLWQNPAEHCCVTVLFEHWLIICHGSDVYSGMSPAQNGSSYLMYYRASPKPAKGWRTGTIQGHGSTLTHHISLKIRSPKSPRVHSGPLCKGFRTSDPQRNAMGQVLWDATTCFYAFSDISKSLGLFNRNFFNILVIYNKSTKCLHKW